VVPVQLLADGVIVMVAVTGLLPELVAVKDGIGLPEPLAARPIDGVLLVHVYVVPDTGPLKVVDDAVTPLQ